MVFSQLPFKKQITTDNIFLQTISDFLSINLPIVVIKM